MSTTPIYAQSSYLNTSSGNLTIKIPPNTGSVTISAGGSGGGGGSGAYTTSHNSWNNAASWATTNNDIKPNTIQVNGDAEFKGNITWQGRDMRGWFEAVESRLSILQPNPQLEEDFDRLKELGDQYRALEKELLEQQRIFDILKNT
ncbi:hypothetical protein UFOVP257_292 [uncultured Caudovirales phage]|uniref:Uncharacterized protein n=1 Tax=uncultured Caudovirales phage TaxID=2100421 RepID=A0A6J5LKQ7_9CAUD|nr:hypothetical protein UFOVP257_292 [uncultured Caudovirales phage]